MAHRVIDWFRRRTRRRTFEAFQIEVTSRCDLHCVMCPKQALATSWPSLDLPWEGFQRIARSFPHVRHVHLQGWGEPLLHPRLFEMIGLAKAAGCRVGFTTNGMRLSHEVSGRLLEARLDLLVVSIAGATRDTHASIRAGSDLDRITENVRALLSSRAVRGGRIPKVEIFFLMTRTNLAELPQAVEWAAALGADELVATNLDYVVTAAHDDLKAFGFPPQRGAFQRILDRTHEMAQAAGLAFRPYPLDLAEVAVCEANPLSMLFIASDGWVSPCTYMGLATRTDIPRRFAGTAVSAPRLRFGNILERDLQEIWQSPAYRAFRRQFATRRLGLAMRTLRICPEGEALGAQAPPPEPCRSCYKLYGV